MEEMMAVGLIVMAAGDILPDIFIKNEDKRSLVKVIFGVISLSIFISILIKGC